MDIDERRDLKRIEVMSEVTVGPPDGCRGSGRSGDQRAAGVPVAGAV